MKSSSVQFGLVLLSTVLLALSLIGAQHLYDQPLHHVPTVLGISALFVVARWQVLSNQSALAIHAFIWLHILGARYIYSFVPYDEWCVACWGFSLSEQFSWQRNHYDRLVHFAYGALATVPQTEILVRRYQLSTVAALIASLSLVMAGSAIYEILEWMLAVVAAPDWADRYNGQQGDLWDAQKDMALAGLGAVSMSAVILVASFRRGS
jgi:putative membrane protein